jgi:hypothetical protein
MTFAEPVAFENIRRRLDQSPVCTENFIRID